MDIKKIENNFGVRLKELRKSRRLSQADLAESLGVDEKYVSRLETASSTPSFAMIIKIAQVLNIEPQTLFKFNHLNTKEELINLILKKISNTSDEKVKLIYKIVESLTD